MSTNQALCAAVIQREKGRRKRHAVAKAVAKAAVFAAAGALLRGWIFMLLVGVVHADWLHQVPTVGYGTACLVAWLWSAVRNVNFNVETTEKD